MNYILSSGKYNKNPRRKKGAGRDFFKERLFLF